MTPVEKLALAAILALVTYAARGEELPEPIGIEPDGATAGYTDDDVLERCYHYQYSYLSRMGWVEATGCTGSCDEEALERSIVP